MKIITTILSLLLLPLALFAALPPTAQDLREFRAIVDSPELNQIISPDEAVFYIGKDQDETERTVYMMESASHTIGVVVEYLPPERGVVGPAEFKLHFYAVDNQGAVRYVPFQKTFSELTPVSTEEGGTPSDNPDLVRIRAILNSPNIYSEMSGRRVMYIMKMDHFLEGSYSYQIATRGGGVEVSKVAIITYPEGEHAEPSVVFQQLP